MNRTVTLHWLLGPRVAPQPFTIEKSPLATILVKVTGVVSLSF